MRWLFPLGLLFSLWIHDANAQDADGDFLHDELEHSLGIDPDDPDSDDDGVPDCHELSLACTGAVAVEASPVDTDGFQRIDALDADDDGDGVPTIDEVFLRFEAGVPTGELLCADRSRPIVATALGALVWACPDAVFDITYEDLDDDGVPNHLDADDDGDGIPTREEHGDADQDGIPDHLDDDVDSSARHDADQDGIPDRLELAGDTDGDGTPDVDDPDDDGDTLPTAVEGDIDFDGDGLPNHLDLDSDDDGVPDADEGLFDRDADGAPDFVDRTDDTPRPSVPEVRSTCSTARSSLPRWLRW